MSRSWGYNHHRKKELKYERPSRAVIDAKDRHGVVTFFSSRTGYGFIRPTDGGGDVFVHRNALIGSNLPPLLAGTEVTYNIRTNVKGKSEAVNLRLA